MKIGSIIVPLCCLITIVLLTSGCSKRIVDVPATSPTVDDPYVGSDTNYPPAEYSQDGQPKEGTLDDSNTFIDTSVGDIARTGAAVTRVNVVAKGVQGMQPIYFHFDQATIPESMTQILIQNANLLKDNPSIYVVVEGNCDERGAKEYNMALGERRALNTKEFLADLGIHANRLRTVSYGEERPVDTGNNEAAWAKNRRVDMVAE